MKRYHILDNIRGFTLINMIGYHAIWDLVYIFDVDWEWFRSEAAYVWQQGICWTFIFLSGFCCSLGSHRFKRGLTVLAAGALISLVTQIATPDQRIQFGVLTLLGSCMLLTALLDNLFTTKFISVSIPSRLGLAGSILLFLITRNVNEGSLGFEAWDLAKLPTGLYRLGYAGNYMGFTEPFFYSTDYFSLMPWCFLFMTGFFAYRTVCASSWLARIPNKKIPVLAWAGRHSLMIYLIHQPVIYAVLYVLTIIL